MEDTLDIGAAHSTDDDEEDVFDVEVERPDWKEPPLHEEALDARTRLSMLEEIQITVNGMNTRLANIENLLRSYLYRNPTPYNSSSSEYSSCSFSSPQTVTVPLETLLTAGEGEVNNSLSMQSVTPEVEDITPNQRDQSTPEMQDLMSVLGIDMFGASGPVQQEVLPYMTSSDVGTSTSQPVSQAPVPTSTSSVTTSQPVSQAPVPTSTSSVTTSQPVSEAPVPTSTSSVITSQPVSEAPVPTSTSGTTTSQSTGQASPTVSQQKPTFENACQTLGLSPNFVRLLEQGCNSRQNLATHLVRTVYSEKERETSNVNGRRGKKRLDPVRMSIVRRLTYTLKPLKPGESEDNDWKKSCTKAIDSANRK